MIPKQDPDKLAKDLHGRAVERQIGDVRGRFTSMEEIKRILFGAPGSAAQEVWEKAEQSRSKERYRVERERLLHDMKKAAEGIFAAMKKRLEAQAATQQETRDKLQALDAYLRTVGVVGQAVKMQKSPYMPLTGEAGVQSSKDFMETEELVTLSRFSEYLAALNVDELIDMVLEDQAYITMLTELHNVEGSNKAMLDFLPKAEGKNLELVDVDYDKDGKRIAKLDPANPKYQHNLQHLCRFILGKPEEGGKEKSKTRRKAETPMWLEIVRSMDFRQKRDLAATVIAEGTIEQTDDFFSACLVAGVMSKEDAIAMKGETEKDKESPFIKLPEDFEKRVDIALAARKDLQAAMEDAVDQIENVRPGNFLMKYGTFNNFVLSRVAEFGALTVVLNVFLDICDRYRRRTEPGRNEGRIEALAKGGVDALQNWRTWAGAGAIGAAVYGISPGTVEDMLSGESRESKEKRAESEQMEFLRAEIQGHPELDKYFLDHYDEYVEIARRNEAEKGKFALYPGDIKVELDKAVELGYSKKKDVKEMTDAEKRDAVETATAVMLRLFMICAGEFRQSSSEQLAVFFEKHNVYSHFEHQHA